MNVIKIWINLLIEPRQTVYFKVVNQQWAMDNYVLWRLKTMTILEQKILFQMSYIVTKLQCYQTDEVKMLFASFGNIFCGVYEYLLAWQIT